MSTVKCQSCDGEGHFLDTTYDRTGEDVECGRCFGTGKSQEEIRRILKPHRKRRKPSQEENKS